MSTPFTEDQSPSISVADGNQKRQQREPDLLQAFFRTRPSILTTVLPRVILSSVEEANAVNNHNKPRVQQKPHIEDDDLPPRALLNTALRRRGFDLSQVSGRFDPLFTDAAALSAPSSSGKKKVNVTEAVIRKANKVIDDGVKLIRQQASTAKGGLMKRIVRTNTAAAGLPSVTRKIAAGPSISKSFDHDDHDDDDDALGGDGIYSPWGGAVKSSGKKSTKAAAKPAGKKRAIAGSKKASPRRAVGKKQAAGPRPKAAGAKRAPQRKIVTKAQRDTDGVMRAKMQRMANLTEDVSTQKQPPKQQQQNSENGAAAAVAGVVTPGDHNVLPQKTQQQNAEAEEQLQQQLKQQQREEAEVQEQKRLEAQRARQQARQELENSKPPPGMTAMEWRRQQKTKMNMSLLAGLK